MTAVQQRLSNAAFPGVPYLLSFLLVDVLRDYGRYQILNVIVLNTLNGVKYFKQVLNLLM